MEIEFIPHNEMAKAIFDPPVPAINMIPESYKGIPYMIEKDKLFKLPDNKSTNLSAKACIPFFDAMTSGYMITSQADVYAVKRPDYNYRLMWEVSWDVITEHGDQQYNPMEKPVGFEKDPFKWETFWTIKTPPGYSCLFIHPTHRYDLPFMSISGVVDTDTYNLPINFPFFLKEDFEGLIPKGTPIIQVIPFKRDEWTHKISDIDPNSQFYLDDLKSVLERSYKKRMWSKKIFK